MATNQFKFVSSYSIENIEDLTLVVISYMKFIKRAFDELKIRFIIWLLK